MPTQTIAARGSDLRHDVKDEMAAGLPSCPYRQPHEDLFRCDAGEGATVSVKDCCACPIPDAISHFLSAALASRR